MTLVNDAYNRKFSPEIIDKAFNGLSAEEWPY